MYSLDFEYDGRRLSGYGFIVCDFESSGGVKTADIGAKITFHTVSRNNGRQFSLCSTEYEECIKVTFDICKDPEKYDDLKITDEEYLKLTRWLNRKEFLSFRAFDYETHSKARYYNASFNISKIKIGEVLYGLRLEMETDKPFAYGAEQTCICDFDDTNKKLCVYDFSEDIGATYVYLKATCYEAGDLVITNSLSGCTTVIKNCGVGEEIVLDGQNMIISSSDTNHKIFNDFNYHFFRIENTFTNRHNEISVSLPCKLEIRYFPIIKDSP